MQILKNKTKISAITFVLILTISAILVALPNVGAHDPPQTIPTWAFVALVNDVIGVNQQTNIVFWVNAIPPTATGAYGDRWTFYVDITKPDGSKETLGPITSDPVGGAYTGYTPDQLGTYTIVARMEDHKITGEPAPPGGYTGFMASALMYVNDTYLASTSDPVTLTVQEELIEAWKETPLPTEYWTRPINSMNRNWDRLAGNWLAGAAHNVGPTNYFAYGETPESPHIMWATPLWHGGIMDARFGAQNYETWHYEGLSFEPPIILDGRIYYNVPSYPKMGWRCLDLYTGEQLFYHNTTGPVVNVGGGFDYAGQIAGEILSFGQIYNYQSPNQFGGYPYLWSKGPSGWMVTGSTTWMMFDPYTGKYICSIADVPSWVVNSGGFFGPAANIVYGKDGSIVYYGIAGTPNPAGQFFPDTPPFYLQVWNTSRAIWYEEEWESNEYWMWRPVLNETYDGNNGYSLNVSIPAVSGSMLAVREGEFIIGGTSGSNVVGEPLELGNLWCLSLEPGQEGTLLWNKTYTPPQTIPGAATTFGGFGLSGPTVDPEDGVFIFGDSLTRRWWGYSLDTMELLWGPSEPEAQLNSYGMSSNIYDGKLLSYGNGGELVAYNITTGEVLWTYKARQEGFESPYGNYPLDLNIVADGKIYMSSSEHHQIGLLWRGSYLRCINASNGAELWKINHWASFSGRVVAADGYLVGWNCYDNRIYCYGKGPTATTVEAPMTTISLGDSVVVRGTVTDVSPGTTQLEQAGRFPFGVPAMSDESMSDWMEYVYMQQACPEDSEGVEVVLTTFDPNGNTYEIGRTTSSDRGTFGCEVDLPVPGLYTIIATFEGSESYYASSAETYVSVTEAPSAAQPIEPEAPTEEPEEPTAP
jgi:hypothetical protein